MYSIFSLATETKGRMKMAFLRVSTTRLRMSSSATSVLPAEVGAEYTRLPPAGMEMLYFSFC